MGRRPLELPEAFALADRGYSIEQIAQELGVSASTVHYWAFRNELALVRRHAKRPKKDMSRVAEFAAAGKYIAEIIRETGICYPTIVRWARLNGHIFPSGRGLKSGMRDQPRAEKMAGMFRQGLSLEKIGQTFSLTRERVRQILRNAGISPNEGGYSKAKQSRDAAKTAKQDARYLVRHGMTFEEYKKWRGTNLIAAYRSQENAARNRGIEWSLNLKQWLEVWQTSGKLELRGRGKGKYVMSRIKDAGGYAIGNVHIQLATENSREAIDKWVGKTKTNRGVFCLYPGTARPWVAKYGRKQVGRFATEAEAAACREEHMKDAGLQSAGLGRGRGWTFCKRMKTNPYRVQVSGMKNIYCATQEEAEATYRAIVEQRQVRPLPANPIPS